MAGLNTKTVAKELGVSEQTIYRWRATAKADPSRDKARLQTYRRNFREYQFKVAPVRALKREFGRCPAWPCRHCPKRTALAPETCAVAE